MRVDELQVHGSVKENLNISVDASPIEVSVERISRKTCDGNSEHSYILFQPVKEEVKIACLQTFIVFFNA